MALQRPKRSAGQIEALPPLGSPERDEYVRTKGASFEPETLVYLLRESINQADTALFHRLGYFLIGDIDGLVCKGGHCESIIMSVASRTGLSRNADRLREFRALVHKGMWQAIYDGSDEKHFWEERFGVALKDKCIEVARNLGRKYRREDTHTDVDDPIVKMTLSDDGRQSLHGLGSLDEAMLISAIQDLPLRQAEAAYLTWVEDRPIAGNSPDAVANIMDISETAVHNLLASARRKLSTTRLVRELRNK